MLYCPGKGQELLSALGVTLPGQYNILSYQHFSDFSGSPHQSTTKVSNKGNTL